MKSANVLAVLLLVLASYLGGFFLGSMYGAEQESALPAVEGLGPKVALSSAKLESFAHIAAVDSRGEGVLSRAEVEIIDGKGRVLFNTNPFVEPDTQQSLETAAKVAFDYTNTDMSNKDVIFSVTETRAQLIGGPSAGAAFAVATIAAIEGKTVKEDIAMTGTIEPDGSIGHVGGIIEKASAAASQGVKLFLVPGGQGTVTFYKEVVEEQRKGNFLIRRVRLVPQQLDLNEYAKENLGIEIREVSNISLAVGLMI